MRFWSWEQISFFRGGKGANTNWHHLSLCFSLWHFFSWIYSLWNIMSSLWSFFLKQLVYPLIFFGGGLFLLSGMLAFSLCSSSVALQAYKQWTLWHDGLIFNICCIAFITCILVCLLISTFVRSGLILTLLMSKMLSIVLFQQLHNL